MCFTSTTFPLFHSNRRSHWIVNTAHTSQQSHSRKRRVAASRKYVLGLHQASLGGNVSPLSRLVGDVLGKRSGPTLQRLYFLRAESIDHRFRPQRLRDRLGEMVADRIRYADRSQQTEPDG